MEFKHFSHEHVLDWLELLSEFSCNMCNRKIRTEEFCYICFVCLNCFIHKECAERPKQIKHHTLHPQHSLLLAKRSLNDTSCCYYCQKPFDNDEFVYACDQLCSDSYMHMACAVIPLPTLTSDVVDGGQDRSFVRYACHEEAMTLVEHTDWVKREAKCFACQSGWSGPAYSCPSEICENFLHKACAELPQKIQPAFHSHHYSLILQVSRPPRSCRSCCKKDCRVMYSCHEDGCNLNLCIECRSLDTRVRSRTHDHLLSLVEKSSCEIQCDACQDSYDHKKNMVEVVPEEFELTRSIIFRCMDCVFNIHFLCGPLPSIIRYEHHIHPLILSDHSTIEDDSDEYYCDVCEKESDQAFRIYCCEECKYVSHIHCLFHEIMKVIKEDTKDHVELQTLGDNRWVHEEIDHSKELIHHEEKEFTLKDIVDGHTEPEKQLLINPFGSYKGARRSLWAFNREQNSWFDRKGSIEEDIDRTHQLFHISHDDLRNFKRDLYFFTVEEGLLVKLDEKYLRQEVEDVGGYMVPKTLAPILITSLRKYGDLGGYESLTPAMKSVTSTILCIVIDKMCKTKVEDLTWDDLQHSYFYLNGIKRITGFKIDMYLSTLKGVIMKAFLGMEADRCKDDVKEKLDRKIATLEAELARWKENREKINKHPFKRSAFMEDCATQASEWKHKKLGDAWF